MQDNTIPQKRRTDYLDNLKIFLTVLVVAHHMVQPYAWDGFWPYVSEVRNVRLCSFLSVNAAFFMGLFFFISGFLHPGSVDRKGVRFFLSDRLQRLGVPLVVYAFTVVPALMYVFHTQVRGAGPVSFFAYFRHFYLGLGPKPADWSFAAWPDFNFLQMWFAEHLVVYALIYAAWRAWRGRRQTPIAPAPEGPLPPRRAHAALAGYTVALIAVTALFEAAGFPSDRWIALFGFLQMEPFHFPQYCSLFFLGILAYRRDWLRRLPASVGYTWLGIGVAATLIRYGHRIFWHFPVVLQLPLHCLLCTSLCTGLLVLFRERFGRATPLTRALAADTYAVYIIHFPIAVAVQYAIDPLRLPPTLAALAAIAIALPASFAASRYILRRLPYARRIL